MRTANGCLRRSCKRQPSRSFSIRMVRTRYASICSWAVYISKFIFYRATACSSRFQRTTRHSFCCVVLFRIFVCRSGSLVFVFCFFFFVGCFASTTIWTGFILVRCSNYAACKLLAPKIKITKIVCECTSCGHENKNHEGGKQKRDTIVVYLYMSRSVGSVLRFTFIIRARGSMTTWLRTEKY